MSEKPGLIRRVLAKLCLVESYDNSIGQSPLSNIPLSVPAMADNHTKMARRMKTDTAKYQAVRSEEERAEQMSELRQNRTQFDESCVRGVKEQVTLMQSLSLLRAAGELRKRSNGSRHLDTVHVLVISDDVVCIEAISGILAQSEKQNFIVHASRTPDEGLHHLGMMHVEVVFLDLQFGIVDVNIRRFMQANGDAIKFPVFIMTDSLESRTAATLKESGVADIVDKSRITEAALVSLINDNISKKASGVREAV